jgi:Na+/melibiose symporter-like transporter
MFYSSSIMNTKSVSSNVITAIVGSVNCIAVVPTIWIFKKFGRKVILWTMSFAIAGSLIGLGLCFILKFEG